MQLHLKHSLSDVHIQFIKTIRWQNKNAEKRSYFCSPFKNLKTLHKVFFSFLWHCFKKKKRKISWSADKFHAWWIKMPSLNRICFQTLLHFPGILLSLQCPEYIISLKCNTTIPKTGCTHSQTCVTNQTTKRLTNFFIPMQWMFLSKLIRNPTGAQLNMTRDRPIENIIFHVGQLNIDRSTCT